ncbi:hypothetical protein BD311DRAFT_782729 [Dichomitus squalens]|uniref:DUF6532 domain-containing protein n=1 Tax=Dichomitus squalens TaxID=114155 RepID=A0A4Q9M4N0_9APHY|nr:hypothetical protein BD311DRAFT_782729 [Dichomitus squalens]
MGPSTRATRKAQRSLSDETPDVSNMSPPSLSRSEEASKNAGPTATRPASTRPRNPTQKQAEIEQQKVADLMKEVERLRKDKARLKRKLATDSVGDREEDDEDEYESEEEQEFRVAEQLHKSAFESRGVFQADPKRPKRKLRRKDEPQSRQQLSESPSQLSLSQLANVEPEEPSAPSPPPSPSINPTHPRYHTRPPVQVDLAIPKPNTSGTIRSEATPHARQSPAQTVHSEQSKSLATSSRPPFKDDKVPKGKPKASDYEAHASRMIVRACRFYSVLICTEDPFPDDEKQVLWADKAWLSVCQEVQVFYRMTDHIEQIIIERDSHARGSLRDLVRPWIESTYGMLTDGTEHSRITNIATYTRLLDLHSDEPHPVFHYQDTFTPSGFALHPIIHKVIQKSWFSDATGLGIRYSTYFSPIRNVTLALLFTAIEFCLDQWETGIFNSRLQFTEKLYRPKYNKHLRAIEEWREIDEEITLASMQEFHDRARRASGAAPLIAPVVNGLSASSRDRLRLELERQRRERQATPSDVQ